MVASIDHLRWFRLATIPYRVRNFDQGNVIIPLGIYYILGRAVRHTLACNPIFTDALEPILPLYDFVQVSPEIVACP